jgi:hypothetical protein
VPVEGERMKDPTTNEEKQGEAPRLDETLRQRLEGLVPEIVRRLFYAGLGAVFTTEEGVRRLATEFSLPKDVASYLIRQAQSTKDDLFRIVAGELRGFLESLNLNEELQRLLTSLSFEIKTEIRFIPNDQKVLKPKIKNKVAVRRAPREEPPEPPAVEQHDAIEDTLDPDPPVKPT